MATSLATLRSKAAVKADVFTSQSISTATMNDLVNEGYRAMWGDVCDKNPFFRVTALPFTLTGSAQSVTLPTDFRAVSTVQLNPGSTSAMRYLTVQGPKVASQQYERTYRLQDKALWIEPLQNCAGNYQLNYNPTCPVLVVDGDTIDAELDAYSDYVVLYAAVEAARIEQSGVANDLMPGLMEWHARVMRFAANSRQAEPDKVEDVRRRSGWGWFQP